MKRLVLLLLGLMGICVSAQTYQLKGKLICNQEVCTLTTHCGVFAFAKAFKLEILETNYVSREKNLVVIVPCPELKGDNFFKDGYVYQFDLNTENKAGFSWIISNEYTSENLSILWAESVDRIE